MSPPPLPCSRAQSTTPSSDVASEANEDELASKLTHIVYRHPSVRTLSPMNVALPPRTPPLFVHRLV